ncbi:MAG: NlpC/P60 family protein [Pseudomonadota bacterium]
MISGANEVLLRRTVVREARRWIGTPYQHQASLLGVGADCLGLVRGVWRGIYGTDPERPPAYSPDWAEAARRETLISAAERHLNRVVCDDRLPGDILLFRFRRHLPAKHAAVLATPDSMVHAVQGSPAVEVALSPWWQRRLAAVFRFPRITD